MTRSASWLLLLSLVLAGTVEAKKSNVKEVCTTYSVPTRGTRTHRAADQVTTIIKHAKACISTAKTTRIAKATTLTSLVPTYTTQIVDYPQETDVFTSTKWSFDLVFPTTTLTEVSTPIVTAMVTVNNPNDVTVRTTSYTLVAPLPTTPSQRRDGVQNLERRASKKGKNRAYLGRDVYCHKEKTVTTTLNPLRPTKPCQTVTLTKKGPRQTVVTKVPFPITVTRTRVQADATSTKYEFKESTIIAPLSTKSVTIIGPESTTTSTVTAAIATQTVVIPEYQVCTPSRFTRITGVNVGNDSGAASLGAVGIASCCHAAASYAGAAIFKYTEGFNHCDVYIEETPDTCPTTNDIIPGIGPAGLSGGYLQCGPV